MAIANSGTHTPNRLPVLPARKIGSGPRSVTLEPATWYRRQKTEIPLSWHGQLRSMSAGSRHTQHTTVYLATCLLVRRALSAVL